MKMSENSKLYNEQSIESLSPLEFTRLRPGVYAGDTTYATQLLVEIISNAIDEFRLGHGNLIEVKIDKDIVQNSVTNAGLVILKNIIQTAKELGFKTLCEGIETKEHFETVKSAGCDYAQGYYLYKPMQVKKFEDIVE